MDKEWVLETWGDGSSVQCRMLSFKRRLLTEYAKKNKSMTLQLHRLAFVMKM